MLIQVIWITFGGNFGTDARHVARHKFMQRVRDASVTSRKKTSRKTSRVDAKTAQNWAVLSLLYQDQTHHITQTFLKEISFSSSSNVLSLLRYVFPLSFSIFFSNSNILSFNSSIFFNARMNFSFQKSSVCCK